MQLTTVSGGAPAGAVPLSIVPYYAPAMTPGENHDRWHEAMLEALEPHEHDFQEFKGSAWLVTDRGDDARSTFLLALSKQVSAFVNGAGGRLFIGISDDGLIDGGVPVDLVGGGTREWLEDVVPHSVDPPLRRCNVFEVTRPVDGARPTRIGPGRAVYVVDLPRSDLAPHQAKDHRYYLRIAGKSRPMGNLHIQDVLRRTRHPRVALTRLGPYGDPVFDETDPRGPEAYVCLRAFLQNTGRILAHHVGLELVVPRPLAGSEVRRRMTETGETHYSQTPSRLTFFRYHPMPIFPSQEVYAASVWLCIHANNRALVRNGSALDWVIFADDAEPARGSQPLTRFSVVLEALEWLDRRLET